MKLVKLNKKEVHKARDYAFDLICKGKAGTFENYFVGALGELAYAKATKQKVNFKVYERGVGDGGADFKNAQVKTVGWAGSNKLLWVKATDRSRTNDRVKKYVLAHAVLTNPEVVYLVGEVSKESFNTKSFYNKQYNSYMLNERELDVLYDSKKNS
jgi:hypothetical protein